MPLLAEVAVPAPLAHALTYEVPASMAADLVPGARVLCELGRRKVAAVVLDVREREAPAGVTLKPIAALVEREPVLPPELLRFLRELADYYFAPIGEVLRLALPAVERGDVDRLRAQGQLELGKGPGGARRVATPTEQVARATAETSDPTKLRGQAALVLAHLRAVGPTPVARLEESFGNARSAVKRLAALGLVAIEARPKERGALFAESAAIEAPPEPTEAQAAAVARLEAAFASPSGGGEPAPQRAFLLFGITGSGKTEVYLRAIAACLARGRGALMLVPEIALTPQLVGRFRARFGDDVSVVHSGLSDADRHRMWQRLRRGEVKVAIGARSALFAPVPDLGLVVVDEEHDGSFKQEEGVRYHARDMALLRAHRAGAVVVLGSATPSLESIELGRRGKLEVLRLPARAAAAAQLPEVKLLDLRKVKPGPGNDRRLSAPLVDALRETVAAGEQAIVFLNRRGFAPSVVCTSCGATEACRACSVSLTFHRGRGGGTVRCHYCGFEDDLPPVCSSCGAPDLSLEGLGTEKLEETIAALVPGARVARLDRDVASGTQVAKVLDAVRRGEVDVLVGTQMVTKGHDLPRVTLVGVVNADAALSLPDFRAAERGFQLLVQVAGRAGRAERPGRVLVQTRKPEHAALRFAAKHDVEGFLEVELADRLEVGYPPFARLGLVRLDALDESAARRAGEVLAAVAKAHPEVRAGRVEIIGPAPAPLERLRGRHRFRVMVRGAERGPVRAVLHRIAHALKDVPGAVRAVIDVDPVAML